MLDEPIISMKEKLFLATNPSQVINWVNTDLRNKILEISFVSIIKNFDNALDFHSDTEWFHFQIENLT
jgi:hypothetical protein